MLADLSANQLYQKYLHDYIFRLNVYTFFKKHKDGGLFDIAKGGYIVQIRARRLEVAISSISHSSSTLLVTASDDATVVDEVDAPELERRLVA
jgi:hypothetical protein